jgi:hypothetical protein
MIGVAVRVVVVQYGVDPLLGQTFGIAGCVVSTVVVVVVMNNAHRSEA